jgi:hypothetical protein
MNQMLLQYFIDYNMKKGWYATMQPSITANWKATSANVCPVPVRTHHENRATASQPVIPILWQRCLSKGYVALEHAEFLGAVSKVLNKNACF